MLTCKLTLPDSPHPVIIGKYPGFRARYLARWNEFRFFSFNKYKKYLFFIFGCWLLPEKFIFCPKNNSFARVRGGCSPPAPWLVRLWGNAINITYSPKATRRSLQWAQCISAHYWISAASEQTSTISGSLIDRITVRTSQFSTLLSLSISIRNSISECRCLDVDTRTIT